MVPFSRRDFLALAAVGRITGPEWLHYSDPATELDVLRLTNPAFTSGMTAPHLRQFTRHGDFLLYWSERAASDAGGGRQAFLLDLKNGGSKQLTNVAALDPSSLALSPDDRVFYFFDGPALKEAQLSGAALRTLHTVAEDATRAGIAIGADNSALFVERRNERSRIVSVLRQQVRRVIEIDAPIEQLMARPRRAQVLYRSGGKLWLVNLDGSGNRQLKTLAGNTGEALWIPSGRTVIYLYIPDDRKELITLREHTPDDGADMLLAKTSQYISASPNADASVFTGASRSRASAYVLILLRVTRSELTLCEHHASDPAMVRPIFSPDSQNVLFVSDRHGKPALYRVHVARFVEETGSDR